MGIKSVVLSVLIYVHLIAIKQFEYQKIEKLKEFDKPLRTLFFSDSGSKTDIMTHILPFASYAITHSCGPNSHVCCQFDFYQKKCYYGKKSIRSEEINERNVKAK